MDGAHFSLHVARGYGNNPLEYFPGVEGRRGQFADFGNRDHSVDLAIHGKETSEK